MKTITLDAIEYIHVGSDFSNTVIDTAALGLSFGTTQYDIAMSFLYFYIGL